MASSAVSSDSDDNELAALLEEELANIATSSEGSDAEAGGLDSR
jgi:hypothetical protein